MQSSSSTQVEPCCSISKYTARRGEERLSYRVLRIDASTSRSTGQRVAGFSVGALSSTAKTSAAERKRLADESRNNKHMLKDI